MESNIGIYELRNVVNKKIYVGKSINLAWRWKNHIHLLRTGKHHNIYLQRAWNKHGKDAFNFSVLEYCEVDLLNEREMFWIRELKSLYSECGYNLTLGGEGMIPDDDVIERIRQKALAQHRNMSKEERALISRKMSNALKGRKSSKESTDKQSEMMKKLWKDNPNWRAKTPEGSARSVEAMRLANTGRTVSEETKKKLSDAMALRNKRQGILDEREQVCTCCGKPYIARRKYGRWGVRCDLCKNVILRHSWSCEAKKSSREKCMKRAEKGVLWKR